jgi:hypothetical protein
LLFVLVSIAGAAMQPYLNTLLVPLYRLNEAAEGRSGGGPGASLPPHLAPAVELGGEVLAHLRSLLGAEAVLAAYNAARDAVRTRRTERKRSQSIKVLAGFFDHIFLALSFLFHFLILHFTLFGVPWFALTCLYLNPTNLRSFL